jgi:predicted secreted protein
MLTAHVATPFTVELAANPTTGFAWEAAELPDGVQLLDSRFTPPATARPGAGGTQSFELQAARPGRLSLRFALRRSWETEAAQHETVEVEVRAD